MSRRFDFEWDQIPNDGASMPIGISAPVDRGENDELYQAWCRERHESIELKLYLDEAVRLLKHMLAEGAVTPESRRRAKLLTLTIRAAKRADRGDAG